MRNAASLVCLSALLATAACAPAREAPSVRFAVEASPGASVRSTRVLGRRVNLREPLSVAADADADDVTVTFATHGRAGAAYRVDPEDLGVRAVTLRTLPARDASPTPPHLRGEPARVALADGGAMLFSRDDAAGRVMAQVLGPDGAARGAPMPVSPIAMDVVGVPRAATLDGRRVVVAFFASAEDGFDVVAASVDASSP